MNKKRRGYSRFFFLFLLLVLLLVLLFYGVRHLLISWNIFHIEKIEISGNENLEKDYLMYFAQDFLGKNLFEVSRKEVMQKYGNIVRIKNVNVKRYIPNILKLNFEERKGIFFLKSKEGKLFPIDDDKIVLDSDNFYNSEVLPIVNTQIPLEKIQVGNTVDDFFVDKIFQLYEKIVEADKNFIDKISEFYIEEEQIVLVEANKGYKIILGENDIKEKLKRFTFLEQHRTFEPDIIVDLQFPNSLIIRTEDK
ncbi:MAG: FtsQ-type POTRA domain-containing protein [Candidatus Cloacimonadota bacterium]|nr:FtsQ-type POTRA domain-containing protein [Candidatus Cloacimonadota bacterium]